jgi:hypothetical protein
MKAECRLVRLMPILFCAVALTSAARVPDDDPLGDSKTLTPQQILAEAREGEQIYREFLQTRLELRMSSAEEPRALLEFIFKKANEKLIGRTQGGCVIHAEGQGPQPHITIRLSGVTVREALNEICGKAGWSYRIHDGRFLFTDSRRYFDELEKAKLGAAAK